MKVSCTKHTLIHFPSKNMHKIAKTFEDEIEQIVLDFPH